MDVAWFSQKECDQLIWHYLLLISWISLRFKRTRLTCTVGFFKLLKTKGKHQWSVQIHSHVYACNHSQSQMFVTPWSFTAPSCLSSHLLLPGLGICLPATILQLWTNITKSLSSISHFCPGVLRQFWKDMSFSDWIWQ